MGSLMRLRHAVVQQEVMHRKQVTFGLTIVGIVLAIAIVWLISPRTDLVAPAVVFAGHTNSATGMAQAVFVISNRASGTLDLYPLYTISTGQPRVHTRSTTPLLASTMRFGPGEAGTVTIARPEQTGPWQVAFSFLPTRPPAYYRLKMWLHRVGLRGMDMAIKTVDVSSEVVD